MTKQMICPNAALGSCLYPQYRGCAHRKVHGWLTRCTWSDGSKGFCNPNNPCPQCVEVDL